MLTLSSYPTGLVVPQICPVAALYLRVYSSPSRAVSQSPRETSTPTVPDHWPTEVVSSDSVIRAPDSYCRAIHPGYIAILPMQPNSSHVIHQVVHPGLVRRAAVTTAHSCAHLNLGPQISLIYPLYAERDHQMGKAGGSGRLIISVGGNHVTRLGAQDIRLDGKALRSALKDGQAGSRFFLRSLPGRPASNSTALARGRVRTRYRRENDRCNQLAGAHHIGVDSVPARLVPLRPAKQKRERQTPRR